MKKDFFLLILIFNLLVLLKTQKAKNIFEENKNNRFCGAGLLKHEIKISSVISQKHKLNPSRKLSTIFTPIRIILDTSYFEQQGELLPAIKNKVPMLKEAMNKAINALRDILEVENYGNDIFGDLNEAYLKKYKINYRNSTLYDSKDIPADLIIIAKFEEEGEFPQGVLASAMPILLYPLTNRPIAGLLTVSRSESFYSYSHIEEYFSVVFLHELTHALGFLESMYPYFPQGIDNILMQRKIRGKTRTLIITPKVVERARKFFNCNSIDGLELEDQGGTGSSMSHWEQRILLGDYMGAVIYQEEMAISEFTLAFLEDSGWYKAKYYTGGLFRFGKNQGCQFIENDCVDNNLNTVFKNEFFDYYNAWTPSCSTGRQSRTYATLNNYQYIEEKYQRYPTNNGYYLGGSIYTADYCPTNGQLYNEVGSNYFYGNCKYGNANFGSYINYINPSNNNIQNGYLNSGLPKEISETLSDNSFCIMTNLVPKNEKYKIFNSIFHPMCYETFCSSKSLTIKINDLYIVCPRAGGNVEVEGYDGYLNCPDYNLICTGTVVCNDIFDCINKKSLPNEESYNYDYIPLTSLQNSELPYIEVLEGYELSDDGICAKDCSQCGNDKQCKKWKTNKGHITQLSIWLFSLYILLLNL